MSLHNYFHQIQDARLHINQKHELLYVIFLTDVVIISGAKD